MLDTPQESDFDDLVRLAAYICQTPISLVSLVDRNRQWFKGRYGLELPETPRNLSICSHTIQNAPEIMEVQDADQDARFATNELVTGPHQMKFYAGAPLVTPEGHALGTLCVIDHKPRVLKAAQKQALEVLSRQVMVQLEVRRQLAELKGTNAELSAAHAREIREHQQIERQQEQALQRSEARFRAIFDHAGLGIGEVDKDGKLLLANDRWCQIVGQTRDELLSMTIEDLTHPADLELTRQVTEELASGKVPYISYEKRYLCGDNRPFVWVRVTNTALRDREGRLARGIVTVEDITKQRGLQAELEGLVAKRTASLNQLVEELEHFSYSITHDMRAPLRAMTSFAEIAQDISANRPEPQLHQALNRIIGAAERMDALITDALRFNKAVREDLCLTLVDLDGLLHGMLETYPQFLAHRQNITLVSPLPAVMGNEAALVQTFSNLIGNAIKFVAPGNVPEVLIRAESVEDASGESPGAQRVRVWVEDKGIGIPESTVPKLFNMFYRGSVDYEGTGIGLALVRAVTHRMGGRVGVESRVGQGSRFYVDLRAASEKG